MMTKISAYMVGSGPSIPVAVGSLPTTRSSFAGVPWRTKGFQSQQRGGSTPLSRATNPILGTRPCSNMEQTNV